MEYVPMTLKEKVAIVLKSFDLKEAGNLEEADRVRKLIPLDPFWAKYWKETVGPQFLIENDFNLVEAEAEFGPDWLTK
ncbi:hypothetical protein ACYULU_03155 [Breznakiellaceae bacterium SP9]